MLSAALKKRFVKDYEIPITILSEPYWSYYIETYDELFSTKRKQQRLADTVAQVGGEDNFFKEHHKLSEAIIADITNTEAYKRFNAEKKDFSFRLDKPYANDPYHPEYHGEYFIAFDLKKASFQALKWYDPELVLNCASWEDLAGKYTSYDYFKNSKYVRQLIFGNLNPKRQRTLIRYLNGNYILPKVQQIATSLGGFPLISFSDDQCVLQLPPAPLATDMVDIIKIENTFIREMSNIPFEVHVDAFRLIRLGDKPYYVREMWGRDEFKCCPAHYFAECVAYHYKYTLTELDCCTYSDGRIVKFLTPLFEDNNASAYSKA